MSPGPDRLAPTRDRGRSQRRAGAGRCAGALALLVAGAVAPAPAVAQLAPAPRGAPPSVVGRVTAPLGACPLGSGRSGLVAAGRPRVRAAVPRLHRRDGIWWVATPAYRLAVDGEGLATLTGPGSDLYTRFPLVMLAGYSRTPGGVRIRVGARGSTLVVSATAPGHGLVSRALVTPAPLSVEVRFEAMPGPSPGRAVRFFFLAGRGLSLAAVRQGFAPDGRLHPFSLHPSVRLAIGSPFAPPPFDLAFRSGAGWFGVGLVQIPDATWMRLAPDGAVVVNYPIQLLTGFRDRGAGGVVAIHGAQRILAFPSFVFTFGPTLWSALNGYGRALQRLGAAPVAAPPGRRPRWWGNPILDTWGQQVVDGVARSAAGYTAIWVRRYVAIARARFGLRQVTVVIDSQWQARLGSATPRASFGGVAGMRRLIGQLQATGAHVLLWWPLWVDRATVIPASVPVLLDGHVRADRIVGRLGWPVDPTAGGFAVRLRRAVDQALGRGPGELGADGLKVDWGSWVPRPAAGGFARPALGIGAAALLRWNRLLYADARAVHPGALIDTSAVAPQFGGTTDLVRLYDARREAEWQTRARIVSAVDPLIGIDGDGWQLPPGDAVAHLVSSVVYGTPALYFATAWADQAPITPRQARVLGAILRMAALKPQGEACPAAGGGWSYWSAGSVAAQTLAGDSGLVIYPDGCRRTDRAVVLSAVGRRLALHLGIGDLVRLTLAPGVPRSVAAAAVELAAAPRTAC